MMTRFKKKPVTIDAEQFLGTIPDPYSILNDPRIVIKTDGSEALITTLEGVMTARKGDWIIKGIKGELYPCKPDIFEATYDAI